MRGPKSLTIARKKLDEDLTKKSKAAVSASKTKKAKASKKNSDAPKRPPTAFFVFMEEFRNSFKENFPENKSVAVIGKAGGEKWKSLSDAEKAPYVAKAAKKKADYEKSMEEFNNKTNDNGSTDTTSDKSSAEVHDAAEQEAISGIDEDEACYIGGWIIMDLTVLSRINKDKTSG